MRIFGYCRISTPTQNIERQERNILAFDDKAVIIREVFTGTKYQGREAFCKLLKSVKANDTIIFDSVSRMSRNATEGFKSYKELFDRGVNLIFLKERHIDTETYRQAIEERLQLDFDSGDIAADTLMGDIIAALNRYIMSLAEKQIQLAFEQSEKEVTDLQQRTREGLVTAKLNGKQIGQAPGTTLITKKSITAKEIIRKHNKTFGGSLNNAETMKQAGVSRMTFYKYKSELLDAVNIG